VQRVDIPWAALAPILLLCAAFVIYCIVDVVRGEVRYLPKWAWVVICLVSIPFGAIVYLAIGKRR
jgi:phospholipase D-like protein